MSFSGEVNATARVSVPATSANLGPGFDSLGLALSWNDEVSAKRGGNGVSIRVTGEGEDTIPRGETNLVLRGMRQGLASLGETINGASVHAHNTIPSARGLGSSSAAIVAGLALAWALTRRAPLDRDWAFQLAVDLEGHPDNVGPAVYGGLTIGWVNSQGQWQLTSSAVCAQVRATVVVPANPLETSRARAVMPQSIPLADAVANSARAALLVQALAVEPALLFEATTDHLHQRYRRALYPQSMELVDHLRGQGLAAYISGAGPTVAILHTEAQSALVRLAVEAAQSRVATLPQLDVYDCAVGTGVQILPE